MPTRSEYYLDLAQWHPRTYKGLEIDAELKPVANSDIDALADLMLDAYHGTIDYDDEGIEDAIAEVQAYFDGERGGPPLPEFSRLAFRNDHLIAACLSARWDQREQPIIAYIMTRASEKRRGLARYLLTLVLSQLQNAGHSGVCAVITDGNAASERLFLGAGFRRLAA